MTLTLASAVTAGQAVTASYTKGTNPIRDAAGNDAANLSDQAVTNTTAPTVSSVALSSNAGSDSTYAIGDMVSATATFSTAVDVDTSSGTPQLELDFEGAAKTATYASGTGTTALVFSYTVAAGDADADGIAIGADKLTLNGGTIQVKGGDTAATLAHSAVAANASHKVDGVRPTLSSAAVSGTALTLTYSETLDTGSVPAGSNFTVKVAGSAAALATSSPVAVSGRAVTVTLASAVTAGQAVTASYTKGTSPIRDAAGNDAANLTDKAVTNTAAPTVSSVALTSSAGADSTYAIGDTVSATATFSTAVDVDTASGTPQLELDFEGTAKAAAYASGTGTTALVFSYTVAAGDADSDGIAIGADKLTLNGGTIQVKGGDTAATLAHSAVAESASHKVDGVRPTLSSAAVSGTALTLTYSEALDTGSVPAGSDFAVKVAGSPADLATSNAVAVSGRALTLTLASAVTAGQAVTASYAKGTSPIRDAAGNDAANLSDQAVTNTTAPTVSRVALTSSAGTDSTYAIGDTVSATATFSTAVDVDTTSGTPQLELNFEGTAKTASYASGTGTAALVFSYTVAAGDADADGIAIGADKLTLNGGTIQVKGGDTAATLTHAAVAESASHKVDGVRPTLSSAAVSGTALTLTYSEALDTGSVPAGSDFAVKVAGSPADLATSNPVAVSGRAVTLTLASAVTAGQAVTASYTKGTNPIRDAAGNDAANLSDQAVTNTTAPTVSSVALSSNAGSDSTYAIGDMVSATATFSTAVDVDTSSGTPQLELDFEGAAKTATYASGTGTTALVFSYTVAAGDADADGIAIGADKLTLNGGTIQVKGGDTAATLAHSAVAANASHKVDGVRPTLSSAAVSGTALTLTYSEILDTGSVPAGSNFTVKVAGSAAALATSSPVAVSGRAVTVTLASAVTAGQAVTASYTKGTSPIRDAAGNDAANLTDKAVTNTAAPTVSSVALTSSAGADSTYAIGDTVSATATFSTAVDVDTASGTPQLELDFEGTAKAAAYASGTGTTALVFSYTVAAGDADSDGIAIGADKLTLNGGTIQVKGGDTAATLAHSAVAESASHRVDGVRPTLSSAAVSGTALTLTYSEALDTGSVPAGSDFAVKVAGSAAALAPSNPVAVSGRALTLTLASAVTAGQAVTASYTKGTSPIRDAAGNDAANLTDQAVTVTAPTALTLTTNAPSDTAAEDAGTVTVTATLNQPAGMGGVSVTLAAAGTSTATATDDYRLPNALTIAAGETSATADVTIVDDDVDEDNETLVLTTTVAGLTVTSATLTITDNDTAGVSVDPTSLPVTVGSTASYTVALDSQPTADVTVTPTSGTPANATVSGAVTFTPAEWKTKKQVTVTGVQAGQSTITHEATSTDPKYPSSLGIGSVTATVSKTYAFASASFTATPGSSTRLDIELSEAAPSDGLVLSVTRLLGENVPVGLCSGSGVVLAEADDIGPGAPMSPMSVRVGPGESSARVNIPLADNGDDRVLGDIECFAVRLGSSVAGWVAGPLATVPVRISVGGGQIAIGSNSDPGANYVDRAAEDAGTLRVPVSVNFLPGSRTKFDLEVVSATTKATEYVDSTNPGDFRIQTKSVTFDPSDTSKTKNITVAITDDTLVEGHETIALRLKARNILDGSFTNYIYTRAAPGSLATLTIADNEQTSAKIAFGNDATSTSAYTAAVIENVSGGSLKVPVTVNHLPAASTVFDVEVVTGGSATEDTDYSIAAKSVTFGPATAKTQNLVIALSDDTDVEEDETIQLKIVAADATADDLGDYYARDSGGSTATITIQSEDGSGPSPPAFVPADNATVTDAGTNITLTFAEAIKKDGDGTELANADLASILTLKRTNASGNNINYTATIDSAKTVITIDPSADLDDGAVYVAISDGWYDGDGNQGSAASATFTVATAPTVSSVALSSSAGADSTYAIGDTVSATATFSKAVDVDTTSGTPQLELDVGGTAKQAAYASGTGTTALVFSYTVAAGDADTDGIAIAANKLALNGGTIQNTGGSTAADLTHVAVAASASHKVDGVRPTLSSAAVSGTALTLTYSEALDTGSVPAGSAFTVTVAGSPVNLANATPVAVSGTAVTLTLASAVTAGQAVTASYTKGANPIRDAAGNDAANLSDQAVTNTAAPTVSSVALSSSAGADNTYAIGDTVSATATFSTAVDVDTASGTPQLELDVGGTAKQAAYASGTGTTALVFSYTVAAGDADTDGIAIGADKLALNGGTIQKTGGSTAATLTHSAVAVSASHKVDGVRPTLSSAAVSGTALTLTYSETLDTGSVPAGSAFTVTVAGSAATLATSNPVAVSGSAVTVRLASAVTAGQAVTVSYAKGSNPIQDAAGNDAGNLTNQAVANTVAPTVSSVALTSSAGADNTYAIGDTASATATFSTAVDVVTTDGTPQLELDVGGTARQAAYASGTGTTALVFSYTVAAGDADADGIAIAANKLTLNSGTIKVADGTTDAVLTHTAVAANASHRVDGVRPTLSSAAVSGTALTLTYSETLDTGSVPAGSAFTVTVAGSAATLATSNPVAVSGSAVTVRLASAVTAGQAVTVSYAKGSNPIQDAAGNDAGNLSNQAVANTVAPTVSSVALSSNAGSDSTYAIGDTVSATATFSAAVDVTGTPQLELDVGGTARQAAYASGTGTTALVFSYTVAAGDADTDGIAIGADKLALNGGTIQKTGGSTAATLTHSAVAANASHKVDGVRPTLSSAAVSGTALTLTYSETLDTGSVPAGSAFTVTVAGSAATLASSNPVAVSGSAVTVRLASAVTAGQAVTVSYAKGSNPIQDAAGNDAGNLTNQAVANTVAPTVSSVALSSNAGSDSTYAIGDTVSATATFSAAVDVTGTPQLELDVGGTAKQAAYASGTGTTALVFSYTVAENDEDGNGISIGANKLALNGGTIQKTGGSTAATLTHSAVAASASHKVDGVRPTLSSAAVSGTALTLTYSETLDTGSVPAGSAFTVTVAGSAATLASSNPVAVSGSAVTVRLASAVTAGQAVTVSYAKGSNPIQDAAGNDAGNLTNQAVANTVAPTVSSVALSSNAGSDSTYAIGDTVSATATFSAAVDVTGTPQLELDVGGTAKQAAYASGTGTTALVFSYTVAAGDADTDGIAIGADKLALNGGTIQKTGGSTAATLTHSAVAASASHKVDGVRPTLSSAAVSGTALTLTYSETLDTGSVPAGSAFTVTVAGSAATLASSNPVAVSGSAVTVRLASAVTAGQAVTVSYAKGSNPIQDAAGNDAGNLTNQAVANTVAPTVSSVALSSNAGSDSTYAIGDTVSATATFSAAVDVTGTPQLELDVGGTAKQAAYASGTGTTALVFSYTVAAGDADTDGIAIGADKLALNGGTIKVANGTTDAVLTFTAVAANASHKVDGVRPTLSSAAVSGTALTLTYSEALDTGSVPAGSNFTVKVAGSAAALATSSPVAVSGRAVTLTLASAVTAGQAVTASYTKGTSPIRDAAGNDAANLTDQAVTNTVAPTVSSVALSSNAGADSTYAIGDTVSATATFSAAVDVDTGSGTPQLELDVGGTAKAAAYASGTGTTALVFSYTVAAGDADTDGIAIGANKLALNGGTIQKTGGSTAATLTHSAVAAGASHKVDGVRPTLSSAAVSGTALTLTYSETLDTGSVPAGSAFTVTVAGSAATLASSNPVAVSGSAVTVRLASAVTAGQAVTVSYAKGSNPIQDAAGNDAGNLTNQAVANTVAPTVSSVALSSNAGSDSTYAIGDTVSATATFSAAVDVTGTPQLELNIGGTAKQAAYASGTGTTALVFSYTVAENDEDGNGISIGANKLALNGGTIQIENGSTAATLTHSAVAASASHKVDGVRPTLSSAAVSGTALTLTYSEALDTGSVPAGSDFTVKVAGNPVNLASSNPVAVSGRAVTLTLASAVTAGQAVTASYAKGTSPIRDSAGNDAANLSDQAVSNTSAPTVSRVALSSSAGADNTYAIGDTVSATATFSTAVDVDTSSGTPQVELDIGGTAKQAAYASGTGTTALVFSYTVAAGDADGNGISIGANKLALNGGTIQKTGGSTAATLTHSAVAASASHKVDGVRPTLSSAAVSGTALTLTYSEALDTGSVPAGSDFTVKVAGSPVNLASSNPVAVSGSAVTVRLASAVTAGQAVTVSYAKGSNPIRDSAGNDAANLSDQAVSNTSAPTVSRVALSSSAGADNTYAIGDTVSATATFSAAVDVTGTPQVELDIGGTAKQAAYASGTGTTALVFSYTVAAGDADTDGISIGANKLALNGGTIQIQNGSTAATLTHSAVTASASHKVDGVRPALSSAAVSGTALTLTYSEALDTGSVPAGSAFTVKVAGSAVNLASSNPVAVSGRAVTLTLASAVTAGQAVTVSYAKGTSPIRDSAGNDAANLSDRAVTVTDTTGPAAPTFAPASGTTTTDAGTNITLTFAEAIKKDSSNTDFSGHSDLAAILTLKQTNSGGTDIPYAATINSAKTIITINPTSNLPEGAIYVAISNAYYDASGNRGSAASATFTVETPSADATLSALTATTSSDGTTFSDPLNIGTFAATTTSYTATVAYAVTHVKLTPTVAEPSATVAVGRQGTTLAAVTSGQASGALALGVGSNPITVRVTAPGATPNDYTVSITRQAQSDLTARPSSAPAAHDGSSAFSVRLQFSEPVTITDEAAFRDHSVEALGGRVTAAERLDGSRWEVTVEAAGGGAVVVALLPTASCADPGALCTSDGRRLSARVEALVRGPDTAVVTIAAVATAITEGEPAAFRLRRTGGTGPALSVGLSVTGADDFIVGGRPQSAAFPAGETTAALDIPTEDDALADAGALLTVELSADTASPPAYVLGSPSRAILQVRDNDGGAAPPALPGTSTAPPVRRKPDPLQLALWTDKPAYRAGETVRLYYTVHPHDDGGQYRVFAWLEPAEGEGRRYLAPLSADAALHPEAVDMRGLPEHASRARLLPRADKALAFEGEAPEPGLWRFVLELRPGAEHEQYDKPDEPMRTRRAWASFTVAERPLLLNRRGFDREIRTDLTLRSDTLHYLGHQLFVHDGATLTIEPGTVLLASGRNTAIIVEPGGRIVAEGTPEAPVVLTCSVTVGRREPGCWGGLRILGRAPLTRLEGVAPGVLPAERPVYGGTDGEDSGGVLRYVRVEFAGAAADPEVPGPAIGLYGAGSGTILDHVQAHASLGDGFAFHGGTAVCDHCVASGSGNAGLSWERGWRGGASHLYVQHGGTGLDGLAGSNDEQGHDLEPRSLPTLSNVTLIHSWPYGRRERKAVAVRLSSGSGVRANDLLATRFLGGAIWAGGRTALLFEDGESWVASSLFYLNGGVDRRQLRGGLDAGVEFLGFRDPKLRDVRHFPNPDPRPKPDSAALHDDGEGYIGAFGRKENWLEEWTVFGPESAYDTREETADGR